MEVKNSGKGFTLVELLIVIAAISVLAVAMIATFTDSPSEARDSRRMTDLRDIYEFLTSNYLAPGKNLPGINGDIFVAQCIKVGTSIGNAVNANLDSFNGIFPEDPLDQGFCGKNYYYYRRIGSKYSVVLLAIVENKENGNCCTNLIPQVIGTKPFDESGTYFVLPVQK